MSKKHQILSIIVMFLLLNTPAFSQNKGRTLPPLLDFENRQEFAPDFQPVLPPPIDVTVPQEAYKVNSTEETQEEQEEAPSKKLQPVKDTENNKKQVIDREIKLEDKEIIFQIAAPKEPFIPDRDIAGPAEKPEKPEKPPKPEKPEKPPEKPAEVEQPALKPEETVLPDVDPTIPIIEETEKEEEEEFQTEETLPPPTGEYTFDIPGGAEDPEKEILTITPSEKTDEEEEELPVLPDVEEEKEEQPLVEKYTGFYQPGQETKKPQTSLIEPFKESLFFEVLTRNAFENIELLTEDVTGDGKPEAVVYYNIPLGTGGEYATQILILKTNNGDLNRLWVSEQIPGEMDTVMVRDVNYDGRKDVVAVSTSGGVSLLKSIRIYTYNKNENFFDTIFDMNGIMEGLVTVKNGKILISETFPGGINRAALYVWNGRIFERLEL